MLKFLVDTSEDKSQTTTTIIMEKNSIDVIWDRILKYSTDNDARPKDEDRIFKTVARGIEFWMEKIVNNKGEVIAILPHNEKKSKLFQISKNTIETDIRMRIKAGSRVLITSDFGPPAPSYRFAIIFDKRIWK